MDNLLDVYDPRAPGLGEHAEYELFHVIERAMKLQVDTLEMLRKTGYVEATEINPVLDQARGPAAGQDSGRR